MNPADYQYFHGVPMPIEPSMLDTVVQLIERLGVSIAVVIMSFYYIMYLTKQGKEERKSFGLRTKNTIKSSWKSQNEVVMR